MASVMKTHNVMYLFIDRLVAVTEQHLPWLAGVLRFRRHILSHFLQQQTQTPSITCLLHSNEGYPVRSALYNTDVFINNFIIQT